MNLGTLSGFGIPNNQPYPNGNSNGNHPVQNLPTNGNSNGIRPGNNLPINGNLNGHLVTNVPNNGNTFHVMEWRFMPPGHYPFSPAYVNNPHLPPSNVRGYPIPALPPISSLGLSSNGSQNTHKDIERTRASSPTHEAKKRKVSDSEVVILDSLSTPTSTTTTTTTTSSTSGNATPLTMSEGDRQGKEEYLKQLQGLLAQPLNNTSTKLQFERDAFKTEAELAKDEIFKLQHQLENKSNEIKQAAEEFQNKIKEFQEKEKQREKDTVEIKKLKKTIQEQQQSIDFLTSQREKEPRNASNETVKLKDQIQNLESQIGVVHSELDRLKAENSAVVKENIALHANQTELLANYDALIKEKDADDSNRDDLENKFNILSKEKEVIETLNQKKLQALEQKIADLQKLNIEVSQKLHQLADSISKQ